MNALVLSGGGVRGAFEAGVIKALAEKGSTWDIIAGVSVGAINAAFLAQFSKSSQLIGAQELVKLWLSISDKDIKKRWFPFGKLQSLWTGGLYNTSPLLSLMMKHLDSNKLISSGVDLRIGVVSLNTGKYKYVNNSTPNLPKWVLASSAFPVAFPPIEIDNELWVDGGIRDITPITDVLDSKPTNVDVIVATMLGDDMPFQKSDKNPLSIALRSANVMADEILNTDLIRVPDDYLEKIKIYQPPKGLIPSIDVLDFNPKVISYLIELGYKVGKGVIKTENPDLTHT